MVNNLSPFFLPTKIENYYWLRKVKEAALAQSGFVEIQQQEVSSACPPLLTASINEIVLGISENTPMDLLANVIKVLKNA